MTHRDKVLSCLNIIALPQPEKRILERQWLETNIGNDLVYSKNLNDVAPSAGGITWVIATELNNVPDTLMRSSVYAAYSTRPEHFHLIDFNNNHKGRSVYRYDAIVEKYSSDVKSSSYAAAKAGKLLLDGNLTIWSNFANQWAKFAKNVAFFKKPNARIVQDSVLMVCLNPRLGVLSELDNKLIGNNRAIIGDMDCESIFDIGSRKHFGLNNTEKSVETVRNLLCKTDKVIEQRIMHLHSFEKPIMLLREVAFDKSIKDLAQNETVGIKNVLGEALFRMPQWVDVAALTSKSLMLTDSQHAEMVEKAVRLDRHSEKHSLVRKEATYSVTHRDRYIAGVANYFAQGNQEEVLDLYQSIYGEKPDTVSEEAFVKSCAAKDFAENHISLDFAFPEFGIVNTAAQKKTVSLSM